MVLKTRTRNKYKKKYNTLKAEFDKMTKETKFKFETETGKKGERVNKGVEQVVVKMINESYTNIMTQVMKDVIMSRSSVLKDKLDKLGKKINEYKIPESDLLTKPKPNEKNYVNKQIAYDIQQLQQLFLDANGFI